MTAALVLAAGASTRMGTPKAMLPFRGGTFLSHVCERLALYCDPVYAVLGAHAERISCPAGMRTVFNPEWELGQLSSLQRGLRALPVQTHAVLFTLVDHPDPAADTVARLVRSRAPVAVPVHRGRRGHPVLFRADLIPELLALPANRTAKDVFRRLANLTEYIEVEDPGVTDDVDDAAALQALLLRTGQA